MGASSAGSYEVTPPGRACAKRHHPPGRRIPPRTADSRQAYGGSDPAGGARYILTGLRELGLLKVLSETACRGDDRSTFRYRDGGRSTLKRPDVCLSGRSGTGTG